MRSSESTVGVQIERPDGSAKSRFRLFGNNLSPAPYRLWNGDAVPNVKEDDPPHKKPQEVMDVHARIFDTSSEDDLKAYSSITDMVGKGTAMISKEEIHWSDKRDTFVIFLRWVELFLEAPSRVGDA